MILDEHQKQEFVSYWGNCPLLNKKGELCSIEVVERLSNRKYSYFGYVYKPMPYNEDLPIGPDNNRIGVARMGGEDLEEFEPYFIESGYYQNTEAEAVWFHRKPERSMIKGLHRSNTEFLSLYSLKESDKTPAFKKTEFDFKRIARIRHGLSPTFLKPKEKIEEALERLSKHFRVDVDGYSAALSKNVAISSSYLDIPVVYYKQNLVGFYLDGKVHLNKRKAVSQETIQEETGLNVEIYED